MAEQLSWLRSRDSLSRPSQDCSRTRRNVLFTERLMKHCDRVDAPASRRCTRDVLGHFGCVNSVELSNDETQSALASAGDDKRVLIWRTAALLSDPANPTPVVLEQRHDSNVFALCFLNGTEEIISGGNDFAIYLHDVQTKKKLQTWLELGAVFSVDVCPSMNKVFVTSSECGVVRLRDARLQSTESMGTILASSRPCPYQTALYNPSAPAYVATANLNDGMQLFDVRRPKIPVMEYATTTAKFGSQYKVMSLRWDESGQRLLLLRRKATPLVFEVHKNLPIYELDDEHYYNGCTMKTGTFAGRDSDIVLAGSDDWSLAAWHLPIFDGRRQGSNKPVYIPSARTLLRGHRSIVNQVRYSRVHDAVFSSGVEKVVKVWALGLPGGSGADDGEESGRRAAGDRPVFLTDDLWRLTAEQRARDSLNPGGDVHEDHMTLAFFDALVKRELRGLDSDEANSDDDGPSSDDNAQSDDGGSARRRKRRRISRFYNYTVVSSESDSSDRSADEPEQPPTVAGAYGVRQANTNDNVTRQLIQRLIRKRKCKDRSTVIRNDENQSDDAEVERSSDDDSSNSAPPPASPDDNDNDNNRSLLDGSNGTDDSQPQPPAAVSSAEMSRARERLKRLRRLTSGDQFDAD